jgi:hypothetical protein
MTIKKNLMSNNTAEVLILGNSHAFFGINPEVLSKRAINVANKSRKLETDYFILKKNIKNLSGLKFLILPISSYTLFTEHISKEEKRLYYNFHGLKEYNQGLFNNLLIVHEPFKELVEDAIFKTTEISKSGWRANGNEYIYDKKIIKERVGNIEERLSRKNTIEKNTNYLLKIIKLCDDNTIKLILLLPPYHPDFYKYTNDAYDIKIKEIVSKINLKSAIMIDSRIFKITQNAFYENVDHLNKNGAILFSKKIDSILNSIVN